MVPTLSAFKDDREQLEQLATALSIASARKLPVDELFRSTDKRIYSPELRGASLKLQTMTDAEIVITGPAETGKTLGGLWYLHTQLLKYPNAQGSLIRKTYATLAPTVIQTFEKKILPRTPSERVQVYGGSHPEWYQYPNGSRLWVGGLDKPSKVLSSERDIIFVPQAEELTVSDWETLGTRVTGRAGNVPYAQLIGDANPSTPDHWIKQRAAAGSLQLLESRHRDNPALFTSDGRLTRQGIASLSRLARLTGIRLKRLFEGKWVQAEGVIYENFDVSVHVLENRIDIPSDWRRFRVIDFGTVHPFVCQWWAQNYDGILFRYRLIYMTGRTVASHARLIKELSRDEKIETTICDHDAGDRLTLTENGIPNVPAKKDVLAGIGKVADRLGGFDALGIWHEPRLFFLPDSLIEVDQSQLENYKPTSDVDEFSLYRWANSRTKEFPVKEDDDGMDATRYLVMHVDKGSTKLQRSVNPFSNYRG